ncbi:MAG: orotidine-5'-phosphate decarboxylase [Gammaproteobacteria bacterium]
MSARRDFLDLIRNQWAAGNFLCVGLDAVYSGLPPDLNRRYPPERALFVFNADIIEATREFVCGYKFNPVFYLRHGAEGLAALTNTLQHLRSVAPEKAVILDAQLTGVSRTNEAAWTFVRECLRYVDAITVMAIAGRDAFAALLDQPGLGVLAVCRTSGAGANEFQDYPVEGLPLYLRMARAVGRDWNRRGNCGLVMGTDNLTALRRVRQHVPQLPLLILGMGERGEDAAAVVEVGRGRDGPNFILSLGRDVIHTSFGTDYAQTAGRAARTFNDRINSELLQF